MGAVDDRFDYYSPTDDSLVLHESVRRQFKDIALVLDAELSESQAKSLALTELESALMWANRAIAMEFGLRVPTSAR